MEDHNETASIEAKVTPVVERIVEREAQRRVLEIAQQEMQKAAARGQSVEDIRKAPEFQKMVDAVERGPVGTVNVKRRGDTGLGRMLVESDAFKHFSSRNFRGSSSAVDYMGLGNGYSRAASLSDLADIRTSLGTDYTGMVASLPLRQLHVRDLLNVVPTQLGAIDFVQQTGYTNAAAAVSRINGDPSSASAAAQSAIVYDRKTYPVVDIETHLPVPRVILQDSGALQGYIDEQTIEALLDAEDVEILRGSGTPPHMTGIMTEANIQTHDWSGGTAGDNRADAILRGIVKAWVAKYSVDGIVMHPDDWADISIMKDSDNNYLIPSVHVPNAALSLWGKPVVLTAQMSADHVLVGAFKAAATYYDRQQATIQILDQHSDWAIKGLWCLYATLRGAVVTHRPENFVDVHLDSAPAGS